MTQAILVELAEAMTVELKAGEFSQQFTPERSYADWDEVLKKLDCLHVDVVPVGYTVLLQTRIDLRYLCMVDIGVRKRFTPEDQQPSTGQIDVREIDKMLKLFEEIEQFWEPSSTNTSGRRLSNMTGAVYDPDKGVEIRMAFVREHLREFRQYTGIMRVHYVVHRAVS